MGGVITIAVGVENSLRLFSLFACHPRLDFLQRAHVRNSRNNNSIEVNKKQKLGMTLACLSVCLFRRKPSNERQLACSAREACCTSPASPASAAKDTTVCNTRLSLGCWAMRASTAADVPLSSPSRCLTTAPEMSPFTPGAPCLGAELVNNIEVQVYMCGDQIQHFSEWS